ncbi:hypothetical protein Psfp_03416 [Pelotomaculum sp. FP]|nr:hypothetical protein Psfp_03416 [Pelotomaculum sp. FP]
MFPWTAHEEIVIPHERQKKKECIACKYYDGMELISWKLIAGRPQLFLINKECIDL